MNECINGIPYHTHMQLTHKHILLNSIHWNFGNVKNLNWLGTQFVMRDHKVMVYRNLLFLFYTERHGPYYDIKGLSKWNAVTGQLQWSVALIRVIEAES